jgi:hypothetical protein
MLVALCYRLGCKVPLNEDLKDVASVLLFSDLIDAAFKLDEGGQFPKDIASKPASE